MAVFTDDPGDPDSGFTVTINWGDGLPSPGSVVGDGLGNFEVTGTHSYAEDGIYPILVTITDPRGQTLTTRGAWKAAADMPNIRASFPAVTDAKGRIYAIGGSGSNGMLSAVDLYDPATNTWAAAVTDLPATTQTNLPAPSLGFGATMGPDGRIYVLGGYDSNFNVTDQAEAYDPGTGLWSTLAPMPAARLYSVAVTGADGRIYVLGGYDSGFTVTPTVQAYDPSIGTWELAPDMIWPRIEFAAVAGHDGRIYAIGGYDANFNMLATVEAYDPTAPSPNAWVHVADMAAPRVDLAAAVGPDGLVYAMGGYVAGIGDTAGVEVYNPTSNIWTAAPSMSMFRTNFGATTGGDGRIYALGGNTNIGYSSTVEAFSVGALVADAPLHSSGKTITASTGDPVTAVVASFTDDNPGGIVSDFTASIDWGDNSTYNGAVQQNGSGGFDVIGTHTYTSPGTSNITVTIRDVGGSLTVANSVANVSDTIPPTVTNVLVRGTGWTPAFPFYNGYSIPVGSGSQLATLPWVNIDQITVVFSENVTIDKADLALSGINTTVYNISGGTFGYDSTTFTATWTLPSVIGSDKLMIRLDADSTNPIRDAAGNRLDGEWTNPASTTQISSATYPSGNGTAGGDFLFRLNVLPCDVDQNGMVISNDLIKVRNKQGTTAGTLGYSIFMDVNGDGMIISNDLVKVRNQLGIQLPEGEPVVPLGMLAAEIQLAPLTVVQITPIETVPSTIGISSASLVTLATPTPTQAFTSAMLPIASPLSAIGMSSASLVTFAIPAPTQAFTSAMPPMASPLTDSKVDNLQSSFSFVKPPIPSTVSTLVNQNLLLPWILYPFAVDRALSDLSRSKLETPGQVARTINTDSSTAVNSRFLDEKSSTQLPGHLIQHIFKDIQKDKTTNISEIFSLYYTRCESESTRGIETWNESLAQISQELEDNFADSEMLLTENGFHFRKE